MKQVLLSISICLYIFDSSALMKKHEYRVVQDSSKKYDKHPCDRVCGQKEDPMVCRYTFDIELFNSLNKACFNCPSNLTDCYLPHCVSADGMERGIITVNRQMPGPPVAVCEGDLVVVEVNNHLHTETTTVHFHGEHFRGYQYMDGTPYVTQCPILPESKFVYKFKARTTGTMFYHSHMSFQRGDGLFGPYIVRQPLGQDPNENLYDFDLTEHFIFPQEWFHAATREAFVLHHWDTGKNKADNMLINGMGRSENGTKTPYASFHVKSGYRYRFRIVSPGFTLCPIQVSVENHTLTLIASDTESIEPVEVNSFILHEGERFDFVLNANNDAGVYQIRFGGLFDCAKPKVHSLGFLIYDDVTTDIQVNLPDIKTEYENFVDIDGPVVNPLNIAPPVFKDSKTPRIEDKEEKIPMSQLKHLPKLSKNNTYSGLALKEQADKIFYLAYDLLPKDNPAYHHKDFYSFAKVEGQNKLRTPQINNISLKLPSSPLLSQGKDAEFCDEESLKDTDCQGEENCACTHLLQVNLGDVVELVLIDEGFAYDVSHPFHIHGHNFYVVSMERHAADPLHTGPAPGMGNWITKERVQDLNEAGKIYKNLQNPPLKDNVAVPDAGFTILRFHADNVGYWLFHCHMSWHNHLGMGVVIKVGNVEETIQPPPKGFPACGDFVGCELD